MSAQPNGLAPCERRPVLSVEEALERILATVHVLEPERVPLLEAAGRILAEARRKTTIALVHGMAIRVEGGAVETIAGEDRGSRGFTSGKRGRGKDFGRE